MSETSAISQADGAEEQGHFQPSAPAPATTLQSLNQAIFDFGAASLNYDVARAAWDAASAAKHDANDRMTALYAQLQAESRGAK